jgi:DNA repair exonuclease SbcCD ATPase subunit
MKTLQEKSEQIFTNLINEANNYFTPYFFGYITEKKSLLSRLSDSASELKKQYLEKIQPKGQVDNLKTKEEIDKAYEKYHNDIEKRNELLNNDQKTREEIEQLKQKIKELENASNELKTKETGADLITATKKKTQEATVDTSDPGVILHTNNKDIAKMKTNVPKKK